jgi:hypothetical protein
VPALGGDAKKYQQSSVSDPNPASASGRSSVFAMHDTIDRGTQRPVLTPSASGQPFELQITSN